jgi:alpha-glucoside transport system substrate-binding protein
MDGQTIEGPGTDKGGKLMRTLRMLALPLILVLIVAACTAEEGGDGGGGGEEENTGTVNVLNALEPEENEVLQNISDDLIAPDAEYEVEFEQVDDVAQQIQIRAEGGTLDVVLTPQPGAVQEQAANGNAVSIEDLGFDIGELQETFGEYFLSLGEFEGEHYGIPTNINLKSMVWYAKDDFDAAGYEVPETWDDLIALSDRMVADGNTPWCVGFEAGGDTGWPATDWMEDIMLGSAGTETYTQWINHEIPFTDPAVVHAGELFGEAMFTEGYVLGGAQNTPATAFADAPAPLFEDPPGCFMHRQASFITAFFEGAESGVDYDWFPFPGENQQPTLFAGELATVFSNRPEVVEFLEAFMGEEVQCAMGSEPGSSRISPNVNVGPDCYSDPLLADASEVLTAALAGEGAPGFDASDQMPPQVGSGSFWTEMMGYMEDGPNSLQEHLDNIEKSWPAE